MTLVDCKSLSGSDPSFSYLRRRQERDLSWDATAHPLNITPSGEPAPWQARRPSGNLRGGGNHALMLELWAEREPF